MDYQLKSWGGPQGSEHRALGAHMVERTAVCRRKRLHGNAGPHPLETRMERETDLLLDLVLLSRATQLVLLDEVLRDLGRTELSAARVSILRLLGRRKRQSVNDLSRFLGQTKASASQNVDGLVKSGYVRRTTDEVDRRCVWVSLTPQGERVLKKVEARQREILHETVGGLPSETLAGLQQGLRSFAFALLEQSRTKSATCLQCCAYSATGCVQAADATWRCLYIGAEGVESEES